MAATVTEFRSAATLVEEIQANRGVILSPRFRSAAAVAGWDEEALLVASLVVEDTPIRQSKQHKSPSDSGTNSRRKRRSRRQSLRVPPVTLVLDDEEADGNGKDAKSVSPSYDLKKSEVDEAEKEQKSTPAVPCIDRLREELSCAICLEICFEPSTTPCGHSFCKKCLKSATARCGRRCPKCRDLIANARSCAVNTVLWNTIQLLFPDEIASRKNSSSPANSTGKTAKTSPGSNSARFRRMMRRPIREERSEIEEISRERSQSEDAALALRLQREEIMAGFRATRQPLERNTVYMARANLRAMASRAVQLRSRRRQ